MVKTNYNDLPVISQSDAIRRANAKIYKAMVTDHPGLISRWKKVNYAVGGSFRFGEIITIAAPSGAGKSYLLNMLRDDFAGELNKNFPDKFKILSFTFEMGADDEVIRTYSTHLKVSYRDLVSSSKKLTKEYYAKIKGSTSKEVDNDIIYYVETSGNREKMKATVDAFQERFPDYKLVITLDHSLLVSYLDEKSEVELVTQVAMLALHFRKTYGALVIMLGQLNDKIEQTERINNPIHHYPKKTDLHGAKAVYHISDTVIIMNRPERLGIDAYGKRNYPAKDLVALHVIKSRLNGTEGIIRMKQDFEHGTMVEWPKAPEQPTLELKN